jgi:hypothetical protein
MLLQQLGTPMETLGALPDMLTDGDKVEVLLAFSKRHPADLERLNDIFTEALEIANRVVEDRERDHLMYLIALEQASINPEKSLETASRIRPDIFWATSTDRRVTTSSLKRIVLIKIFKEYALTNLEQALASAEQIDDPQMKDRIYNEMARKLALTSIEQALVVAHRMENHRDDTIAQIAEMNAITNSEQALMAAGQIQHINRKADILQKIAKLQASENPEQAFITANQIQIEGTKILALLEIAKKQALASPERSNEIFGLVMNIVNGTRFVDLPFIRIAADLLEA